MNNYGSPYVWETWDNYFANQPPRYANAVSYRRTYTGPAVIAVWSKDGTISGVSYFSVRGDANGQAHGYAWETKITNKGRIFHPLNALNGTEVGQVIGYYNKISDLDLQQVGTKSSKPVEMTFEESVRKGYTVIEDIRLDEEQEQLIQWILRSYGGLFSDYVFIDERRLATLSGIPDERVYQHLLALTRARILHYIPRKRTPYVTFTRKRVETDRIVLPPEVYDDRKKGFKERIEAMLHYAEEMDFCRSKVLLHYFGEEDSPECGQCDVCRRRQPAPTPDIETLILEKLKDGKKHAVGEMEFPGIPRDKTAQSLKRLMEEETVLLSDGMLHLPGTTPC